MQPQATNTNCQDTDLIQTVRAAQRGDRKAFGRLVMRYERAVYAVVIRRLGNHAEAQEVCQDVFVQALRKIDQLRDPVCFGGWIRSIAGRMAINRAVRQTRLISFQTETMDNGYPQGVTPLGAVLAGERQQQVQAGLGRLRDTDRNTLEAFYFQGRSVAEMSESFDSPVGTIKRRLHVARKRLAKELAALAPA